jgi:hypothetical protein
MFFLAVGVAVGEMLIKVNWQLDRYLEHLIFKK